jgi:hypothetical protein
MTRDPLDDLLDAMARLLDEQAAAAPVRPGGGDNFRCQRCEGCEACRFCSDCTDCVECTYCDGCVACTGCTQSRSCRDCNKVSHSQLSRACDDSAYLTLCIGCEQSVHCFACVALQGGEFCILNEKLSRKDYNARVAELRIALERRLATGWRPTWLRDDEDDDDGDADDALGAEVDDDLVLPDAPRVVMPSGRGDPPRIETTRVAEASRAADVPRSAEASRAAEPQSSASVVRARPPRPVEAAPPMRSSVTSARRPVRRD